MKNENKLKKVLDTISLNKPQKFFWFCKDNGKNIESQNLDSLSFDMTNIYDFDIDILDRDFFIYKLEYNHKIFILWVVRKERIKKFKEQDIYLPFLEEKVIDNFLKVNKRNISNYHKKQKIYRKAYSMKYIFKNNEEETFIHNFNEGYIIKYNNSYGTVFMITSSKLHLLFFNKKKAEKIKDFNLVELKECNKIEKFFLRLKYGKDL